MKDNRVYIPNRIYFRIGDVAEILGLKPYVIRFWETEFPFVSPEKAASGQRVYRRPQIEGLILIKQLLHIERYSIEGAKKKLTELRKAAKLKDTMHALVRSDTDEKISVGSTVDKEQTSLQGQTASLQEKIADLQKLIREPGVSGHQVPGLENEKSKK